MKTLDKTAYFLGILFYFSLFVGVFLFLSIQTERTLHSYKVNKEIEQAAKLILDTPDLTTFIDKTEKENG